MVLADNTFNGTNLATIERDSKTQQGAKLIHHATIPFAGQIAVAFVLFLGRTSAVIASQVGDRLNFGFGIAKQVAIANQVVGVFVMRGMANVMPDSCAK